MTTQQSIDMSAVIDALAQSRPAFYSESDFNHALSWQIQKVHPSMGVRQEVGNLIEGPDRRYVDIWLPDCGTAIELKYLTRIIRSRSVDWEEHVHQDTGLLGISTKHVYFSGARKEFRVRYDQILT